jgi:hypothetical protein
LNDFVFPAVIITEPEHLSSTFFNLLGRT